jgi:hypothetical protein
MINGINIKDKTIPSYYLFEYSLIIFVLSGKIGILNYILALLKKSHIFNSSHFGAITNTDLRIFYIYKQ